MSFASTMNILSNINCFLSSGVTYLEQRKQGIDAGTAAYGLFNNIGNGMARNAIAYDMAKCGNPIGYDINLAYGYGNPVANTCATMGLMTACSPWMFFNSPFCGITPCYGMGMPYAGGFNMGFGYGYNPGFFC